MDVRWEKIFSLNHISSSHSAKKAFLSVGRGRRELLLTSAKCSTHLFHSGEVARKGERDEGGREGRDRVS